jgi:release factor glutamine methyltransferase
MTIKDTLTIGYIQFKKAELENYGLEAEKLLAFILEKPREFLLTHPEKIISPAQLKKYQSLIKKRCANWPLAYLAGQKNFYNLNFKVNPCVLIPRPETEIMVDEIVYLAQKENLPLKIIDVGAGSGCIITAVAKNLKNKKAELLGLDISAPALKLAQTNARLNHAKNIKFIKSNLLQALINKPKYKNIDGHLIIAANLPYLTPAQFRNSLTIQREPKKALVASENGLKYYRELFEQIKKIQANKITLFCEIDPGQKNGIIKLAHKFFPQALCQTKNDLAGLDRLVIISL